MMEEKRKLGGTVPPTSFVAGCDTVCGKLKSIKTYWGTGDMAGFACEHMATYGCVFDDTPPQTAADLGC